MFAPVYLDHNATTPMDAAVLAAMMPFLTEQYGNASSRHEYGRAARRAVDTARQQVAMAVGAHPTEVIFTSGGTEANNLFLKGVAALRRAGVLAVSAVEHPCVLRPADQLVRQGWQMTVLPVDHEGLLDRIAYAKVMTLQPAVVSVMLANNETGVLQPVEALAGEARHVNAWFHTDAVQALGKQPVDFRASGVHAMTVSAHKIYGPKGAGALILDKRVELSPLLAGGGHERGLRSGTENVAAIVGFGVACELAVQRLVDDSARMEMLQARLEDGLRKIGATVFGAGAARLPNTSFFALPALDGETLVGKLDRAGYAIASGSACSSADPEPSHVLRAMGVAPEVARGAVRVSLGRGTRDEDVCGFLATLEKTVVELMRLTTVAV